MENSDLAVLIENTTRGIKKKFPNLSQATIMELFQYTEIIEVPKKGYFIKAGQFDRRIVIVVKGLFRAYYLKDDVESTIWFREEYDVYASYSSILSEKPSSLTYQAVENSVVVVINYDLLKEKAMMDQEVAKSIIAVLEGLMLELIESLEEYIILNPEERFIKTLDKKPKLINRVPQSQLASLLGITPESFSRLKSRLKSKGEF